MTAVALVAFLLWPSVTAFRVANRQEYLQVSHRVPEDEGRVVRFFTHHVPFWPSYWRHLVGLPWPGTYRCGCGFLGEDLASFGDGSGYEEVTVIVHGPVTVEPSSPAQPVRP